MRATVQRLAEFGPLAAEESWTEETIRALEAACRAVEAPLTGDEAAALARLLDRAYDDTVYGLTFTVLHLIETHDYSQWQPTPAGPEKPWLQTLWQRWERAGFVR